MNRAIALCLLIGILWTGAAAEPGVPPSNYGSTSAPPQALTVPVIVFTSVANTKPMPKPGSAPGAGEGVGTVQTVVSTSPEREPHTFNSYVLRAIEAVPSGGGYAVTKTAMANLCQSMRIEDNESLVLTPAMARPSFCSSATYLIFLHAIEEMETEGHLKLSAVTKRRLLVNNQRDGVGVWGRWNANGPGTARLFYELKLGRNFTELSEAQPGDFVKVWWTDAIGAKEKGHSVIFLGTSRDEQGALSIIYWSSNIPMGFGEKTAPISKIKHMVFSRFEHPERLNDVGQAPAKDAYLASMLTANESFTNLLAKVGVLSPASRAELVPEEAGARR